MKAYCIATMPGGRRIVSCVESAEDVEADGTVPADDPDVPEWVREKPDGCYDADSKEPLP